MSQAPLHVVESTELPVEIAAVAKRIADLIGPLPATDIAIPGASWTVGEAAAHLVLANRLMAAIATGRPSPYGPARGDGPIGGVAVLRPRAGVEPPVAQADKLKGQAGCGRR
jgi:hypothetical protein